MDSTTPLVSSVRTEPDVTWPSLEKPVIVTRDFTLLCKKGLTKDDRVCLKDVKLEVLVNGCLYIVGENPSQDALRRGNIISRNMKETKKRGGSIDDPATHCFIRYDHINDARRGIGRIDGNYKKVETPNLSEWRKQLDKMMRLAWTLHRVDGKENEFEWISEKAVRKHAHVVDEKKVEAHAKTVKAASKKDRIDRRNTGMIPLLCGAADDRLFARIQNIRGIGRRMDWRGVVLEHFIDQIRSKCAEIQRDVEQKLSADTLFGPNRTTRRVKKSAEDMRAYAKHLRTFNARPFTRVLAHAADDLESAAAIMDQAADDRDGTKMEAAKLILRRIYRSMTLLELDSRLEEVLVIVAEAYHRKSTVQGDQLTTCIGELGIVRMQFSKNDPFTKEPLEEGFKRKILGMPRRSVEIAWRLLNEQRMDPSNRLHTKTAYEYLKQACSPF